MPPFFKHLLLTFWHKWKALYNSLKKNIVSLFLVENKRIIGYYERMEAQKLTLVYDEDFEAYHSNEDKNFIAYAKRNFKDLMEGKEDSEISRIYHARVDGDKNFRKIPFFIYVLFQDLNNSWIRPNIKKSMEGEIDFEKDSIKKILKIIDAISDDPNLKDYLKSQEFYYIDIYRIIRRYKEDHQGIIEKKLLKSGTLPEMLKSIFPSMSMEELIDLINLKYEILDYIKFKEPVIQSELRWKRRRFQKISKDLFEKLVYDLEREGRIAIKTFNRRRFVNYLK